MSQASNMVKWCLNKAKKEVEDCKKQGLRIQHRGLLKTAPNAEKAKKHLNKAEHNLNAIIYLLEGNFEDVSVSMVFYSMYHCMLSIAAKFGYESRNQSCTISLMECLKEEGKINIDDRFINMLKYADVDSEEDDKVIEMREEYTYGTDISVTNKDKIKGMIEDCRKLIDATRDIVLNK